MAYDNTGRDGNKAKLAREENTVGNGFFIVGVIVLLLIAALAFYYYYYAHNAAISSKTPIVVPEVNTGAIDLSNTNNKTDATTATPAEKKTNQ